MNENTRFRWLLGNGESRKCGPVIQGAEYEIEPFGADVVAEWVKTGAAEYVVSKAKKVKE